MPKQLSKQDSQAIDMLLDRTKGQTSYSQPDVAVSGRIETAGNLLSLLDHWAAEEPAAGLVQRTLARIAQVDSTFSVEPIRHINPHGPIA